jgi:hypothetical protein
MKALHRFLFTVLVIGLGAVIGFGVPSVSAVAAQNTVKPYDYAMITWLTYHPDEDISETWIWPNREDWHEVSRSVGDPRSGYFGITYVNTSLRKIVIGHRGTDFGDFDYRDIADDVLLISLLQTLTTEYAFEARAYISNELRKIAPGGLYAGYSVSHTGHSMGGYIAQLAVAEHLTHTAVVFDAPGIGGIGQVLGIDLPGMSTLRSIFPRVSRNYAVAPNFINTIQEQISSLSLVDPNWRYYRDLNVRSIIPTPLGYWDYSLQTHDLDLIIRHFDPETGQPYTSIEANVFWPRGLVAGFANFVWPYPLPATDRRAYETWRQFTALGSINSIGDMFISIYNDLPTLDPLLNPEYGQVDISQFPADTTDYIEFGVVVSKGEVSARTALVDIAEDCYGYTNQSPDLRVVVPDGVTTLGITFDAESDSSGLPPHLIDTTLIVNAADSSWHCNDDQEDRDPLIVFENSEPGVYDIWVGSFNPDSDVTGSIVITFNRAIGNS